MNDVTSLLSKAADGDEHSQNELFEVTEIELRRIALHWLRRYSAVERVRATEVIDNAFLKLMKIPDPDWHHRGHFYSFASRNIMGVIIDLLRRRDRDKSLEEADENIVDKAASKGLSEASFISLQQALDDLEEELSETHRQVVELKFFAECTFDEIAEITECHRSKVDRMLRVALGFLETRLRDSFPCFGFSD